MSYGEYLKTAFQIIKLDRQAIARVSKDSKATKWGIITVILAGLISGILVTLFTLGFGAPALLAFPLLFFISIFVSTAILFIISKLFGSKGTYIGLFRPLSLGSLLNAVIMIPLIGSIASIWSIVITIVSVSETQKLSTGKATAVVLIPIILAIIIAFILAVIIFVAVGAGVIEALRNGL
jgi:hypothetical protein